MPAHQNKELKEKIIEALQADKARSFRSIGDELGCSPSTVKYHAKMLGMPKRAAHPYSHKKVLPPAVVRQIQNLTVRGLSARQIAQQIPGVTQYMVYVTRKGTAIEKPSSINTAHPDTSDALVLKAVALKKSGMSTIEIAKMFGKTTKSMYQMMYYYNTKKPRGERKELSPNGNHTASTTASTNGHGNGFGPSKGELIGFAWAQVERGLADIASRIALPPDMVRRRISELLGYSAMR